MVSRTNSSVHFHMYENCCLNLIVFTTFAVISVAPLGCYCGYSFKSMECDLICRAGGRFRPSAIPDPELLPRELDVGGAACQVSIFTS